MHPGKLIFLFGLAIAALGALIWLGRDIKWLRLFRLPGDIAIERNGFAFYFPITTMLLVGILLSAILWLFRTIGR